MHGIVYDKNCEYDNNLCDREVLSVLNVLNNTPPSLVKTKEAFLQDYPQFDYNRAEFAAAVFKDHRTEARPKGRKHDHTAPINLLVFHPLVDKAVQQMLDCYNLFQHTRQVTDTVEKKKRKKLFMGLACQLLKVKMGAGGDPSPLATRCLILYEHCCRGKSIQDCIENYVNMPKKRDFQQVKAVLCSLDSEPTPSFGSSSVTNSAGDASSSSVLGKTKRTPTL